MKINDWLTSARGWGVGRGVDIWDDEAIKFDSLICFFWITNMFRFEDTRSQSSLSSFISVFLLFLFYSFFNAENQFEYYYIWLKSTWKLLRLLLQLIIHTFSPSRFTSYSATLLSICTSIKIFLYFIFINLNLNRFLFFLLSLCL